MAKAASYETDLLELIFNGTAIADLAENDTTSPATNLYVSLHTADPSAGNQSTSEVAYGSYARVAVARTSGGWTVSGNGVSNTAEVQFPAQTDATSGTITHFGIGTTVSGATALLYAGSISPTIAMANGVQPTFASSDITVTES